LTSHFAIPHIEAAVTEPSPSKSPIEREPETVSPWPHGLAVVLVCATFPLIWVGALVTTTKAGMAVPDWPTTYGYNLFLYPWTTWVFGPWDLFIEHGHRLLGAGVGLITIGLCVALWRCENRSWLRYLGVAALVMVIAQGVLGGRRVQLDEVRLAQLHGCLGPLFFGLSVALAAVTSRWWRESKRNLVDGRRFERLALLTTFLAYLQIVLGSNLRHIPPGASHDFFRTAVFFHLVVAVVVLVQVLVLAISIWRARPGLSLTLPTTALVFLLVAQIGFGGATWLWKYGWPLESLSHWQPYGGWLNTAGSMGESLVITSHVALGSLILATALLIALRCGRYSYLSMRSAAGSVNGGVVA